VPEEANRRRDERRISENMRFVGNCTLPRSASGLSYAQDVAVRKTAPVICLVETLRWGSCHKKGSRLAAN
jgi:hypothetical protein